MRGTRLGLAAAAIALAAGIAVAQKQPPPQPDTNDDAAAAVGTNPRKAGTPPVAGEAASGPGRRGGGGGADATRAFLGLGAAPDATAAARGKPVFAQNCAACHGPDARGGIGPNLLYSNLVLDDVKGNKLGPFLQVGRPDKGMPPFPQLSDGERADIAEWLHQQVDNYANRGTYQNTNDLLTGDRAHGAAFFQANCTQCHSASADLKGVGARYRPLDLQRNMIFPVREDHPTRQITAQVRGPTGQAQGRVVRMDDFDIVLIDQAGNLHAFRRDPDVRITFADPLAWHRDFAYRIKDGEMTDLVTYLASLK